MVQTGSGEEFRYFMNSPRHNISGIWFVFIALAAQILDAMAEARAIYHRRMLYLTRVSPSQRFLGCDATDRVDHYSKKKSTYPGRSLQQKEKYLAG